MKTRLELERDFGTIFDTVNPEIRYQYEREDEQRTKKSWLANWMDASEELDRAPSPKGKVLTFD